MHAMRVADGVATDEACQPSTRRITAMVQGCSVPTRTYDRKGNIAMDAQAPARSEGNTAAHDLPVINILGDRVALGPLCRELVPTYQRWINDFAVLRTLAGSFLPTTMEQESAWYERMAVSD